MKSNLLKKIGMVKFRIRIREEVSDRKRNV